VSMVTAAGCSWKKEQWGDMWHINKPFEPGKVLETTDFETSFDMQCKGPLRDYYLKLSPFSHGLINQKLHGPVGTYMGSGAIVP